MSDERITVSIDEDLEDLIPGFLENRRADIEKINTAIKEADYFSISRLGHSIKGVGGGYGFDEISIIGEKIEHAAKEEDEKRIIDLCEDYINYLDNIHIVYE